jgi:formate-dependent nitrite reductase cytochrome c552 subunit
MNRYKVTELLRVEGKQYVFTEKVDGVPGARGGTFLTHSLELPEVGDEVQCENMWHSECAVLWNGIDIGPNAKKEPVGPIYIQQLEELVRTLAAGVDSFQYVAMAPWATASEEVGLWLIKTADGKNVLEAYDEELADGVSAQELTTRICGFVNTADKVLSVLSKEGEGAVVSPETVQEAYGVVIAAAEKRGS